MPNGYHGGFDGEGGDVDACADIMRVLGGVRVAAVRARGESQQSLLHAEAGVKMPTLSESSQYKKADDHRRKLKWKGKGEREGQTEEREKRKGENVGRRGRRCMSAFYKQQEML